MKIFLCNLVVDRVVPKCDNDIILKSLYGVEK